MTAFEERMAAFRARFLARASTDGETARQALATGDFATLKAVCHGLSGNAGMFGHADLGDAAQAVEEAIDAGLAEARVRTLGETLLARIDGLAQEP